MQYVLTPLVRNGYNLGMRDGYANALLVLIWGMAAGFLLWASGVDIELQRWLWENYNHGFNRLMRWFGQAGKGGTIVAFVLLACAARLLWLRLKNGRWVVERCVVLMSACAPVVALAGAASLGMKVLLGRPRPKMFLWNDMNPREMHPFSLDSVYWSFPSGHACSIFAICVWLMLAFPRWRWALMAAAVVVAASRFLAISPHYLGDVVGGASLGAAVAMAAWQWSKERRYV